MYLIRFIDFNGTKREYLSTETDLRLAVECFYLDECPQHISSVVEVHAPEAAARVEAIKICKEMIP